MATVGPTREVNGLLLEQAVLTTTAEVELPLRKKKIRMSMLSCMFTVQLTFSWSLLTTRRLLRRIERVQTRVLREGVPRRRGRVQT
jgi:hypothetical protein